MIPEYNVIPIVIAITAVVVAGMIAWTVIIKLYKAVKKLYIEHQNRRRKRRDKSKL